jgi:hypothetical protein
VPTNPQPLCTLYVVRCTQLQDRESQSRAAVMLYCCIDQTYSQGFLSSPRYNDVDLSPGWGSPLDRGQRLGVSKRHFSVRHLEQMDAFTTTSEVPHYHTLSYQQWATSPTTGRCAWRLPSFRSAAPSCGASLVPGWLYKLS